MELNVAKGICLVAFFFITLILGTLPLLLIVKFKVSLEKSDRGKVVLAFFNCFAGGVFLGTCLLNMLTEGQEQFEEYKSEIDYEVEYPFFQVGVGLGFFLVVLIDKAAHAWILGHHGNRHSGKVGGVHDHNGHVSQESELEQRGGGDGGDDTSVGARQEEEAGGHNHGLIHVSGIRAVLLLVAMSFHTIFDGLAVGLQDTETGIWSTTVAISIHKAIVAVCLGLELAEAMPEKPRRVFLSMLLFSFMTPMGVAIGMGVTSGEVNMCAQLLTASVLQALATGVFLYVTFLEVLGPELQSHHLGVPKVMVATLGFAVISGVKVLDRE